MQSNYNFADSCFCFNATKFGRISMLAQVGSKQKIGISKMKTKT